jgi:hypothetical protein
MTHHAALQKARPVNETSTSHRALVPTITEPVSAATATGTSAFVFDAGWKGAVAQNRVMIFPYGLGSDTNTFNMRIWGWRYLPQTTLLPAMWFPFPLAEFLCAISSGSPGLAGQQVIETEFFADTITVVAGQGNVLSYEIVSPANDTLAHVLVTLKGSSKYEITFDMVTGTTSANALLALI